jgi:hypothetical protein
MKIEAVSYPETSVDFYQTTRYYFPYESTPRVLLRTLNVTSLSVSDKEPAPQLSISASPGISRVGYSGYRKEPIF